MAEKIIGKIKLQILGGGATPAPPVGPALGQHGLNIMEFCNAFNEKTKSQEDMIIPVVITVYEDKSYSFVTKSPPVAVLLKKATGIAKASGQSKREKIGKVTAKQLQEIAQIKMADLNAVNLEGAVRIIEGTARSMGIETEG